MQFEMLNESPYELTVYAWDAEERYVMPGESYDACIALLVDEGRPPLTANNTDFAATDV